MIYIRLQNDVNNDLTSLSYVRVRTMPPIMMKIMKILPRTVLA